MSIDLVRFAPPTHDHAEPPTFAADELKKLGTYRGTDYAVTPGGTELRIGRLVYDASNPVAKNEVRVTKLHVDPDPRSKRMPGVRTLEHISAWVVPAGTYQSLVDRDKAAEERKRRNAERARTPHRVDLASLLSQLDRQPAQPVILGGSGSVELDLLGKRGRKLIGTDDRPEVRGIEVVVGWLNAHGVRLEVVGDQLDVRSTAMSPLIVEVLGVFGPLIVGHLSGHPVACVKRHTRSTPAYTLAVGYAPGLAGIPVCEKHLEADE